MSELLQWVQQKDEKYFFLIFDNKSIRSFWKIFLGYVSKTGDGYLFFLTTLFGFFIADNSYQFITVALFAIALDKIIYLILKKSLKRPRPFRQIEGVKGKLIPFDEFSFPSGHTGLSLIHI